MVVTSDGFKLTAETCSIFWVLKLLPKAAVVVVVVVFVVVVVVVAATLLPYLFIFYLTSLYQSVWFSVGNSSDYV